MAEHEPGVEALLTVHKESDPKALILRLCRELLAESPTDRGPTPLRVLGSCRSIRDVVLVPVARQSQCSGVLAPRDGGYRVMLDEEEPLGRQNRSLAHEIVHTFFREVSPGPPGPVEEALCEVGAAELTMPTERVWRLVPTGRVITFDTVSDCALEFEVTNDAAARRLIELSPYQACYLVAKPMAMRDALDREAPALRVASWTLSPAWPDRRPYRGLTFTPSSVVARAFKAQDRRAGLSRLGTNHRDGVYDIEAKGYTYARRGEPCRQVAILVHARTRNRSGARPHRG